MRSKKKRDLGTFKLVLTLLFLLLFSIIVFAIIPEVTFNLPLNASATENNWMLLNISVFDDDLDTLEVKIYGSNESNVSNKNLLYRSSSVSNGSIITYNWSAPKIINSSDILLMLYFDNQTSEGFIHPTFDPSMMGWWHLDETSGVIVDSSGMGNNCSYNGTLYSQPGIIDSGIGFDGIDDEIQCGNSSGLDVGNESFTIAAWYRNYNGEVTDYMIQRYDEFNDIGWQFMFSNGYISMYATDGTNWALTDDDSGIKGTDWHHAAMVRDRNDFLLYVDGKLVASHLNRSVGNLSTYYNLSFGWGGVHLWYNGILDEVILFNRSLSAEEIKSLANKKFLDETGGSNGTGNFYDRPLFNYSGKLGPGLEFNGINDSVRIADSERFNLTGNFSVSFWVFPYNLSKNQTFITKGNGTLTNFYLDYKTTNKIEFGFYNENWRSLAADASSLNQNSWSHIVAVWNAELNTSSIYINGILRGSLNLNWSTIANSEDLVIGSFPPYGQYFSGILDEVIIFNKTLTSEEVLDMYRLRSGNWYWKFSADDSSDINISETRTFFIGRDWNITPLRFGSVSATPSINITLGNITFVNTRLREVNVSVNITSDWINTFYNQTVPFDITTSKPLEIIEVNVTAPADDGLNTITLTLSGENAETSESVSPFSYTVTADLITSQSQPFLYSNVDSLSSNIVKQGDTNIELNVSVINQGQGLAQNILLSVVVPQGWTNSSGDLNRSGFALNVGERMTNRILLNVGKNSQTGDQKIYLNVSGFNASGDLLSPTYIRDHSIDVTVLASPTEGTGPGSGSDSGSEENLVPPSLTGLGSSGGTSKRGGEVKKVVTGEISFSSEVFEVIRGNEGKFPIVLKNVYENAVLEDIHIDILGFMSQYVNITPIIDPEKKVYVDTSFISLYRVGGSVPFFLRGIGLHSLTLNKLGENSIEITLRSSPKNLTLTKGKIKNVDLNDDGEEDIVIILESIVNGIANIKVHRLGTPREDKIYFMEEREYSLSIFVPPYVKQEEYELTVNISAKIIPLDPDQAGFEWKPLTKTKKFIFRIFEMPPEEAELSLSKAREDLQAMIDNGFPVDKTKDLLSEAEQAFENKEYSKVLALSKEISQRRLDAFTANALIEDLERRIEEARLKWMDVTATEKALVLAKKAFGREDFESALQRVKDAQLTFVLDSKKGINILLMLIHYWWVILVGFFVFIFISSWTYKKISVKIIQAELKRLSKEEVTIHRLIEDLQFKHFRLGTVAPNEYYTSMAQYEHRLNEINERRIRLRNKRVGMVGLLEEVKSLENEEKELIKLMKQTQVDYLNKGIMSKRRFLNTFESEKIRLAEIEEEKEILKSQIRNKHKSKCFFFSKNYIFVNNRPKRRKRRFKFNFGEFFKDIKKLFIHNLDKHGEKMIYSSQISKNIPAKKVDLNKRKSSFFKKNRIDLNRVKVILSDVSSLDKAFFFCNGVVAKNIYELIREIDHLNEKDFSFHVNDTKDDFAKWIKDIFGYYELYDNLMNIKDKNKYLRILKRGIEILDKRF